MIKKYNILINGKGVIAIKYKRLLLALSLIITAFLFTGCFLFNSAPLIVSTAITTATEGALYTYEVEATDPEGDALTYSLTTSPTGMTINSSTGVITWIPTAVGSYEVTVEVSDLYRSTSQPFIIIVSATKLTSIVVLPANMSIPAGQTDTITSVTAYYDNGTEADIALTACIYESNNTQVTVTNGVIKVLQSCTVSNAIITVYYTEGEITKSDTVNINITSSGGG